MELIESFTVDHLRLLPGLYVSRTDRKENVTVTTYDLRFTAPNREPPLDMPAVHTIEHLGATFMRRSAIAADVVYFGPMGCRTGFYLLLFGDRRPEAVCPVVKDMLRYITGFSGDIPGASPISCGNWREQNPDTAKYYAARYLDALENAPRFTYPDP